MNALKLASRLGKLALLCLAMLESVGCLSFRRSAYSYQELEQRNREQREKDHQFLKPGTTIYSN
jgi:hypothetical protein